MTAVFSEMKAGIDAAISGKTYASDKAIWSSINDGTSTYAWNATGPLAGEDLSFIQVWNTVSSSGDPGAWAVRPVHARCGVVAYHINQDPPVWVGKTVRFVTPGETVQSKVITQADRVGSSDTIVVSWASPLSGIRLLKIPPVDYLTYLPILPARAGTVSTRRSIPVWYASKLRHLNIAAVYAAFLSGTSGLLSITDPTSAAAAGAPFSGYTTWWTTPSVGDSSCGLFSIIGDDAICWGGVSTDFLWAIRDDVNTVMDAQVSGASLTHADWSSYLPILPVIVDHTEGAW